jgi:hypothetical protein
VLHPGFDYNNFPGSVPPAGTGFHPRVPRANLTGSVPPSCLVVLTGILPRGNDTLTLGLTVSARTPFPRGEHFQESYLYAGQFVYSNKP